MGSGCSHISSRTDVGQRYLQPCRMCSAVCAVCSASPQVHIGDSTRCSLRCVCVCVVSVCCAWSGGGRWPPGLVWTDDGNCLVTVSVLLSHFPTAPNPHLSSHLPSVSLYSISPLSLYFSLLLLSFFASLFLLPLHLHLPVSPPGQPMGMCKGLSGVCVCVCACVCLCVNVSK